LKLDSLLTHRYGDTVMRWAGLFLLASGWGIAFSTLAILHSVPVEMAFVVVALAIEVLGFVFLARSFLPHQRSNRES
jgi:hypothetical protein